MLLLWILLGTLQGWAQQAPAPETPPRAPPSPPLPYPHGGRPPAGSLWEESQARMLVGLDGNARAVGDLVTVRVVEQTRSQISADTSTNRSSQNAASVDSFFGLNKKITDANSDMQGSLGFGTGSEFAYSGSGDTLREGRVDAVITCAVVEVLPNGNLRVVGHKSVGSNNERQYLTLVGIVRPQDIQADNTVSSALIAELDIALDGRGTLGDDQKAPMGSRLLKRLWPF